MDHRFGMVHEEEVVGEDKYGNTVSRRGFSYSSASTYRFTSYMLVVSNEQGSAAGVYIMLKQDGSLGGCEKWCQRRHDAKHPNTQNGYSGDQSHSH